MFAQRKALVSLGAAALVLATFAGPAISADGKSALKLAPKDTVLFVSVNFDRLKKSPLYKDAMAMAAANPDTKTALAKLKTEMGVDIEKDVSTISVALPTDFQKSEKFLIVLEGNFDERKIIASAKKEGAKLKTAKHKGQKYYVIDGQGGVAFMGKTVLVGTLETLKAAIAARKGGGGAKGLVKLVHGVDTGKDAWFVFNVPAAMRKEMAAGDPNAKDLKTLRGSLDLAKGIGLSITMGLSNAAAAKNIGDQIKKQMATAGANPMMAGLGLGAALQRTQVEAKGGDLRVGLSLTPEEVTRIKALVSAGMAAQGGSMAPPPPPPVKQGKAAGGKK